MRNVRKLASSMVLLIRREKNIGRVIVASVLVRTVMRNAIMTYAD